MLVSKWFIRRPFESLQGAVYLALVVLRIFQEGLVPRPEEITFVVTALVASVFFLRRPHFPYKLHKLNLALFSG